MKKSIAEYIDVIAQKATDMKAAKQRIEEFILFLKDSELLKTSKDKKFIKLLDSQVGNNFFVMLSFKDKYKNPAEVKIIDFLLDNYKSGIFKEYYETIVVKTEGQSESSGNLHCGTSREESSSKCSKKRESEITKSCGRERSC